jgi:hypothetical protein
MGPGAGAAINFSVVERYSGDFYREMKASLDWLVAPDPSTGRPNFLAQPLPLVGSTCARALPAAFWRPFLVGYSPPEAGCFPVTGAVACKSWCSFACKRFWGRRPHGAHKVARRLA